MFKHALLVLPVLLPVMLFAQNITSISGFHASAESDPFAKNGVLEVSSAPSTVAGLNAQATVTIGCQAPNPLLEYALHGLKTDPLGVGAALFGGVPGGYALAFRIGIVGANLDIVTTSSVQITPNVFGPPTAYSTQNRSVQVKMRFDGEDTIYDATKASDTHHVEFAYFDTEHAGTAHRLLIGLSANGHSVNLQLNLGEAHLASVIQECAAVNKQFLLDQAKAIEKEKTDRKEREEANVKEQERSAVLRGAEINRIAMSAMVQKELSLNQTLQQSPSTKRDIVNEIQTLTGISVNDNRPEAVALLNMKLGEFFQLDGTPQPATTQFKAEMEKRIQEILANSQRVEVCKSTKIFVHSPSESEKLFGPQMIRWSPERQRAAAIVAAHSQVILLDTVGGDVKVRLVYHGQIAEGWMRKNAVGPGCSLQ